MDILFGRDPWAVIAAFAVCGVLLGMLYDALYVKRLFLGAFRVALAVDDLFFSLAGGVLFVVTAYAFGNGNIRWYEFPAMFFGFAAEHMTLSRAVRGLFGSIAGLLKKLLGRMIRPLRNGQTRLHRNMERTRMIRRAAHIRIRNR